MKMILNTEGVSDVRMVAPGSNTGGLRVGGSPLYHAENLGAD